jgi:hypothetical protein
MHFVVKTVIQSTALPFAIQGSVAAVAVAVAVDTGLSLIGDSQSYRELFSCVTER